MQIVILIACGFAVLYFGAFYAAPGPEKSATEPVAGSRDLKVSRNFFISILILFALDGAIFHSGLYESILKPESHAGKVARVVRQEKQRKASGLKEVLLLGDSRIGHGFSEEIANEAGAQKGVRFVKRSIGGSSPRVWYYILREIDPLAQRYRAIVMANQFDLDQMPLPDGWDIVEAAPLLRYSDACAFASSFREWKYKCRAFTACLLRGSAFQSDLFDLLEQPTERLRRLRQREKIAMSQPEDVVGVTYDLLTNKIKFPQRFTQRQVESFRWYIKLINPRKESRYNDYFWMKRILERYANSSTTIVLAQMPRAPLLSLIPPIKQEPNEDDKSYFRTWAIVIDEHAFEFLETPEYFSDAIHLNRKGEQLFTERLTNELLTRLEPVEAGKDQPGPSG
jgi:hypothetical protein